MDMNKLKVIALCMVGLSTFAQDGTVTSNIYQYDNVSSWPVENAVPGGVGATITVTAPNGKGQKLTVGPSGTFYSTNAVIGRLVWPKSDVAGDLNAYDAVCTWLGCYSEKSVKDNVAPTDARQSNNKCRWTVNTNTITMDNGGDGAEISIDAYNDNVGGKAANVRYLITPQLVLNDNLTLRHVGRKGGPLGDGSWPNGDWLCMMLAGGITDNGNAKSLTVDLTPTHTIAGGVTTAINAVYLAGKGDFTGDVVIRHGVVRTGGAQGHDGVGNQLGHDNVITATNGFSGVDLCGCTFDCNNTIKIGGIPQQGFGGVLSSSYLNPLVEAVWKSPVQIVSETAIGGSLDPATYAKGSGNLRISGPISDGGNNATLHIRSYGNVTLDGDNTFGGNLSHDSGFLTLGKAASAGTGRFIFNGGTYRVTKSTDYDVMSGLHEVTSGKRMAFKVEEGVTYAPAANDGGSGFYKSGRGTLVLAHANPNASSTEPDEVEEGEVVLDFTTAGATANLTGTKLLRLANDARIVWRSAQDAAGTAHPNPPTEFASAGAFVTLRNEGWGYVDAKSFKDGAGVFNVEDINGNGFVLASALSSFTSPRFICNRSTYAYQDGTYSRPALDADYAATWGEGAVVDVKAGEPATTAPGANATASRLRFNTPNGGSEVLVTLTDETELSDGAILVTAAMGTTPVRITGGSISYPGTGTIRIMNFNTNATLTIESDIVAATANVNLFVCGPGRTILRGNVVVGGSISVSEGVLAVDSANQLVGLKTPGATKNYFKNFYLTNGGRLGSNGTSFSLEARTDPDAFVATPYVYVSRTGGGYDASGDDVISLALSARLALVYGGAFVKDGTGTLRTLGQGLKLENAKSISKVTGCGSETVNYLDIRAGVLDTSAGSSQTMAAAYGSDAPTVAFVRANATQKGAGALTAPTTLNFGALEMAGRWQTVCDGGTVDLDGVSATIGALAYGAMDQAYGKVGPRGDGPFSGPGDMTIDNTGAAASINAKSVNMPDFTGTLTAKVPFDTTGGLTMPKGMLALAGEGTHQFKMVYTPWQALRLGALSGTAALTVEGVDRGATDAQVVIGRDRDETVTYQGVLTMKANADSVWRPLPRLVKTGSNTLVLGNAANDIKSATTVEDGTLVAGAATALGTGAVYLGGAGAQAGATPCFKTGAGVAQFANDIQVLADTPAGVTCSIGGNAELTGAVTLKAPTLLTAAAGETLRVAGTLSIQSSFGKSGSGSVELADDVTVGDFTYDGGTMTVEGTLTIKPNSTLTVTPAALKEKGAHVLFEADAISGSFTAVVGLESGWRLKSASGKIWLCPPGFMLHLK